jgi:hypothetical protein
MAQRDSGAPPNTTCPSSKPSRPAMERSSRVLPEPVGPVNARRSPRAEGEPDAPEDPALLDAPSDAPDFEERMIVVAGPARRRARRHDAARGARHMTQ